MHGFEWKDQRGIEGIGFVRALRTLLTSHLPVVLPNLNSAIANEFEKELRECKAVNGNPCLREEPFSDVDIRQIIVHVRYSPQPRKW